MSGINAGNTATGLPNANPQPKVVSFSCCLPWSSKNKSTAASADASPATGAEGGFLTEAIEDIGDLVARCIRYGVDVVNMINKYKEDVNRVSKEGIILLDGIADDIDNVIIFFQMVMKSIPTANQKPLETTIFGLQGVNVLLRNMIQGFITLDNMIADADDIKAVIEKDSSSNQDIATTQADIKAGLNAASEIGMIPKDISEKIQNYISSGLNAISTQAVAKNDKLPKLNVPVRRKHEQRQRAAAALSAT